MTGRRAKLSFILLLACCGIAAAQQEEPEILVEASHRRVYEGQPIQYTVILNHIDRSTPPELEGFDDFDVAPAGEKSFNSQHVTIVNGERTVVTLRGRQYNYRLTPLKTGTLTIPAPKAVVDGRQIVGQELTLTVVPAAEQDVVVMEIAADRREVYPMQRFTVTLSVDIKGLPGAHRNRSPLEVQRSPPALQIPWAADDELPDGLEPTVEVGSWLGPMQTRGRGGFRVNNFSASPSVFSFFEDRVTTFAPRDRRVERRDHRGEEAEYWQYEFPRTFVGKRVGRFQFGPVTLRGVFATGFDADGELVGEEIYAVAKPIGVTVKDVPAEGRPDSFTGAVGRFRLSGSLAPKRVKVGDPVTLTLDLVGEGTLETTSAPELQQVPGIADHFTIYDGTQETSATGCRFTYSLRPREEGIDEFPAVPVAYFDVEQERYVTLRTDPIPIEVTEAQQLSTNQIVSAPRDGTSRQRDVEARREGVFANVVGLGALRDQSVRPGWWLAGLAGLAGAYAALAVVTVQVRRVTGDEVLRRRRGAPARARQRLREAVHGLEMGHSRESADRVRSAVVGLIADVADVPEAGLTPKDARRALESLGFEDDLATRAGDFLETCDAARYGVVRDDPDTFGRQASALLEELIGGLNARKRLR